jgi:hypothetical protein
VRHGDLKLVVSRGGSGKPELYDLAADLSESKDLGSASPEAVKELQGLWDRWNAEQAEPRGPESKAKPKANRKKKPKAPPAAASVQS